MEKLRLGLILRRTVTNVVPSSMALTAQIFSDTSACSEIRRGLEVSMETGATLIFPATELENQPLLQSMYAETLRLGIQIHVPRNAPHQNIHIGDKIAPKQKLILVNTWLAHTDEAVWNTKKGTFPLTRFWARRFLIDPKDPSSGPTRTPHQERESPETRDSGSGESYFSTEGLEGAWIPYGGMTFATLHEEFD